MTETNPPRLCYVEESWAFFTTQPVADQWGDDWNDVPYEHNAERPYEWRPHSEPKAKWEIRKVAWEGPFETPADVAGCNSGYSVEMINRGCVAWLAPSRWADNPAPPIHAGATLEEFCSAVVAAGGTIYRPTTGDQ